MYDQVFWYWMLRVESFFWFGLPLIYHRSRARASRAAVVSKRSDTWKRQGRACRNEMWPLCQLSWHLFPVKSVFLLETLFSWHPIILSTLSDATAFYVRFFPWHFFLLSTFSGVTTFSWHSVSSTSLSVGIPFSRHLFFLKSLSRAIFLLKYLSLDNSYLDPLFPWNRSLNIPFSWHLLVVRSLSLETCFSRHLFLFATLSFGISLSWNRFVWIPLSRDSCFFLMPLSLGISFSWRPFLSASSSFSRHPCLICYLAISFLWNVVLLRYLSLDISCSQILRIALTSQKQIKPHLDRTPQFDCDEQPLDSKTQSQQQ